MIFRQKPPNIEDYLEIDSKTKRMLNKDNILPKYFYKGKFYFINNEEINSWLKKYYEKIKGGEGNE